MLLKETKQLLTKDRRLRKSIIGACTGIALSIAGGCGIYQSAPGSSNSEPTVVVQSSSTASSSEPTVLIGSQTTATSQVSESQQPNTGIISSIELMKGQTDIFSPAPGDTLIIAGDAVVDGNKTFTSDPNNGSITEASDKTTVYAPYGATVNTVDANQTQNIINEITRSLEQKSGCDSVCQTVTVSNALNGYFHTDVNEPSSQTQLPQTPSNPNQFTLLNGTGIYVNWPNFTPGIENVQNEYCALEGPAVVTDATGEKHSISAGQITIIDNVATGITAEGTDLLACEGTPDGIAEKAALLRQQAGGNTTVETLAQAEAGKGSQYVAPEEPATPPAYQVVGYPALSKGLNGEEEFVIPADSPYAYQVTANAFDETTGQPLYVPNQTGGNEDNFPANQQTQTILKFPYGGSIEATTGSDIAAANEDSAIQKKQNGFATETIRTIVNGRVTDTAVVTYQNP